MNSAHFFFTGEVSAMEKNMLGVVPQRLVVGGVKRRRDERERFVAGIGTDNGEVVPRLAERRIVQPGTSRSGGLYPIHFAMCFSFFIILRHKSSS